MEYEIIILHFQIMKFIDLIDFLAILNSFPIELS